MIKTGLQTINSTWKRAIQEKMKGMKGCYSHQFLVF